MIDPFHLEAYGVSAVNYNRDVEAFPVLVAMFEKILGDCPYKSPTDMGVNMAGNCMIDDDACRFASGQEIIRRYYTALCEQKQGKIPDDVVPKLEILMKKVGVTPADRKVVSAALEREAQTGAPAAAMELPDGRIITGKTSELLSASSAVLLNALKALANISDDTLLITPTVIEPIKKLKSASLHERDTSLHPDEILIALSICATMNPLAQKALEAIKYLRGSDAHSTVVLSDADKEVFRKLGITVTYEPYKNNDNLYYN